MKYQRQLRSPSSPLVGEVLPAKPGGEGLRSRVPPLAGYGRGRGEPYLAVGGYLASLDDPHPQMPVVAGVLRGPGLGGADLDRHAVVPSRVGDRLQHLVVHAARSTIGQVLAHVHAKQAYPAQPSTTAIQPKVW